MPPRFLHRLPVAILAALLLGAFAAVASAKRTTVHRLAFSATTRDLNGDGRIDAIDLRGSSLPTSASSFSVSGHRLTGLRADRGGVRLLFSPASKPDTASRPIVSVGAAKVRARDGAAPVLTGAPVAQRRGSGSLDAINLSFSEPVIARSGAVQVHGYRVVGMHQAPAGKLTVSLAAASAHSALAPSVSLIGADLRDAAGNRAASRSVRIVGTPGSGTFAAAAPGNPAGLAAAGAPSTAAVTTPGTAGTTTGSTGSATSGTGSSPTDGGGNPPLTVTPFAGTNSDPFDQSQMQMMPFGERSFYLQPWRSYEDTFPATRMLNAVGINFNIYNNDAYQVSAGAQLLHDAGFTHARIEIPWNDMDYEHPDQLSPSALAVITRLLQQFKAKGIRPLILLNSNSGIPCPIQNVTLNVTAPAPAGATQVQLDSASAALVQPGYTGFYQYNRTAGVIITAVSSGGLATLSQPLNSAIAAGPQSAATLKFQPFFPPFNSDGSENANTDQTLDGWLEYVGGVTSTAKSILGNDNFDVEVWNEISFGSQFLDASNYYNPAPAGSGPITRVLLGATAAYITDPSNGLPDVGVGDGFANQTPFPAGQTEFPGVTAIDKHPYASAVQFPSQVTYNGVRPADALGNPAGTAVNGTWHDTFVPKFTALLPEYFLTGLQTETVTRDLAPFVSSFNGVSHGRTTHQQGSPPPAMWVTEVNEDASTVNNTLTSPDGSATSPMSSADLRHFETKAILRYLSAWVGKGATMMDFYAIANAGGLDLVDQSFFTTADQTHAYPGLASAGETMVDVQRFLSTMSGAQNLSQVMPLSLNSVSDYAGDYQFAGNGTANYPPLYNRNMVAFFPFQVTANKWVIPTYVMTEDLATLYNKTAPATDVTRQDLPPETFQLTIGGINGLTTTANAVDPLTNGSVPAAITARAQNSVTLQVPLTDSPRMLTLQDS